MGITIFRCYQKRTDVNTGNKPVVVRGQRVKGQDTDRIKRYKLPIIK